MAQKVIFEEQEIKSTAYSSLGSFVAHVDPAPFVPEVGETYKVVFDGVEYECIGQDGSIILDGARFIGNASAVGLLGNNEPFIIGGHPSSGVMDVYCLTDTEYTAHTLGIYQETETTAIILKDRDGNDLQYDGGLPVRLLLEDGTEQTYIPGEAQEKTVAPNFSAGDVVVKPDAGKLLTKVTIPKPETLTAENIVKDVEIAGIVGTHESGGGSGTTESESIVVDPEWIDDICFWDYDGTLVLHFPVDDAAALSELPEPPAHYGLTFLGWNYTLEQVRATEYPLDIGAMYIPTDGKTHLHLSVTDASYLKVPLNWSQTVTKGVSIDWGDGTSATTVSGTGVVTTTHTYSAIGEYDVTITVVDGCVMTLGGGTSSTVLVGSSSSYYKNYLTELFIGNNVNLGAYALRGNSYMAILTMPNTIDSIPDTAVNSNYLPVIVIPNSVTSLGNSAIANFGSYALRLDNTVISIPESVTTVGTNLVASSAGVLRLSIPKSITELPKYTAYNTYRVRRIFMSNNVTAIGAYSLNNCYHIERITLPSSLATIGDSVIDGLYNLKKLKIPRNVTTIGSYFMNYCYRVEDVFIPKEVTSIGSNSFTNSVNMRRLTIEGATVPASPLNGVHSLSEIIYLSETVPDTVRSGGYYCEIYVPDSAFDDYYAKVGSENKYRVHKLSDYPGELPTYE